MFNLKKSVIKREGVRENKGFECAMYTVHAFIDTDQMSRFKWMTAIERKKEPRTTERAQTTRTTQNVTLLFNNFSRCWYAQRRSLEIKI